MEKDVTIAPNHSVWIELRGLLAKREHTPERKEEEVCEPRNSRGR